MNRREFLKESAIAVAALSTSSILDVNRQTAEAATLPVVWYWKECSAANLLKALAKVQSNLTDRIAVKLHSGEPHGPNIIPPAWVKQVVESLPKATAVECNVLYTSPRKTTEGHRETLKINGWNIPFDIMDEDGDVALPVKNGLHLKEVAVGKNLLN